jgi:alanine racemase
MTPALDSSPEARAGATLIVDLAALVENWRTLKRKLDSRCDPGAVVKADAYGLGLEPVARALQAASCSTFYVAHLDEGLALRSIVEPSARVVVMHGPNSGTERDFAAHNLIPVLNSRGQIESWGAFARANDVLMESIVQVDTGMNRLGLSEGEFATLMESPDGFMGLTPLALMSHLACAETPNHPLNESQRALFASMLSSFREKFAGAKGTLVNSSGIFLGNAFHYDFARPGVALYGVNPTPACTNTMVPVVRLQAKILQVHRVGRTATVGYGATYKARDGSKLATVSAGYADGNMRALSNIGHAYIDEFRIPVAGRVSMDLMTFDVSNVPDSVLDTMSNIDLIGRQYTLDDIARDARTIGYEILTSFGDRYHRRYLPAQLE